jgi:hypothetical protein
MTRIAAFTALQKALGQESAEVVAEYVESQQVQQDLGHLATKDDLKDFKIELLKEFANVRQEIAKTREEFLNRLLWTAFLQVLTIVGAIVALVKFIPN